jgi:ABC-type sugar transport system substrate-binding protein
MQRIEEAFFMSRRRKRAFVVAAGLVVATAATLTALTTTASGSRSTVRADKPKVAIITLYREPLAQWMVAGAKLAAQEYGADFHWQGPPGLNPPAEVKMLQDEVAAGTKGIVLMQYPPDLFNAPIRQAVQQGVSVVTTNVAAPESDAKTHVGPGKVELGIGVGKALAPLLKGKRGYLQAGICVPGLDVLVAPFRGLAIALKKYAPGVRLSSYLNVTGDPATNFTAWQRIITQKRDALGFVGNCDQDAPNLIKVKATSKKKFIIADTSGDSVANLKQVQNGTMNVMTTQTGFVEGYVAMKLILEKLVNGKPIPEGWLDTGVETVVPKNAAGAIKVRQQIQAGNLKAAYTYYKRAIVRALTMKPKDVAASNTEANPNPLVTP